MAFYRATVSLAVEESSVSIAPGVASAAARTAAEAPADWLARWPPETRGRKALSELDDEAVVTMKFRALFDFASVLAGDTSREINALMEQRWPDLSRRRRASTGAQRRVADAIDVEATLRADGRPEWGYVVRQRGDALPTLAPAGKGARSEFDLYVQNHVRCDLAARLELRVQ